MTQWILKPQFFQVTGESSIKHTDKYFSPALEGDTAAVLLRCQLSPNPKLFVILASHLNGVSLPTVIIPGFDLYLQREIVFVTQGIITLV